jgi:hypothetical protein
LLAATGSIDALAAPLTSVLGSRKASAARSDPRGLGAKVRHQQHQINQLKAEIAQLRALITHAH